jgi:hypothetical protein
MSIKENKTTVRRFHDAISVQDACNPSGISLSMHEHYRAMLAAGASTFELQSDCAMALFIMKLADLAGITYSATTYGKKLHSCREQVAYYKSNPIPE